MAPVSATTLRLQQSRAGIRSACAPRFLIARLDRRHGSGNLRSFIFLTTQTTNNALATILHLPFDAASLASIKFLAQEPTGFS